MKRIRRDAKRFKNCDCDEFFEVVEESPNYYLVQRADAPKGVLNAVHKYGYVEIKPNELREDEFPSEFRSEMSDEVITTEFGDYAKGLLTRAISYLLERILQMRDIDEIRKTITEVIKLAALLGIKI